MRAAFLVAGLVAVAGAQDINRTCVNDADTRRINSGFNPCTHSEVADGNKMIPGKKEDFPFLSSFFFSSHEGREERGGE